MKLVLLSTQETSNLALELASRLGITETIAAFDLGSMEDALSGLVEPCVLIVAKGNTDQFVGCIQHLKTAHPTVRILWIWIEHQPIGEFTMLYYDYAKGYDHCVAQIAEYFKFDLIEQAST